jgi:LETM1 and EF-hand domain-containing protein 1
MQESNERLDEADQKIIGISKRVRSMIKKIDTQLELYDEKVGSSLNVIESNEKGQITLADLQRAMRVIKHAPPEEVIENLGKKLDVDQDGFVVSRSVSRASLANDQELEHVIELAKDEGLGIVLEEEAAKDILHRGANIKNDKADLKDKK